MLVVVMSFNDTFDAGCTVDSLTMKKKKVEKHFNVIFRVRHFVYDN
jgi:hypothetical protein